MKFDQSLVNCSWPDAFSQIVNNAVVLDPILIVGADIPEKVYAFRDYLRSRADVLVAQLGRCSNIKYIEIELLLLIDPSYVKRKLKKDVAHQPAILHLRSKILELSFRPLIVIDNCQFLNFNLMFRLLRMINELEDKALFVFILPVDYVNLWCNAKIKNKRLAFFLKIIKQKYEFGER
ncbi:MAG: hypothetical protein IPJ20_19385 [Flammeovirgaceae bacterium]|nr:hypothetical protein [Flammeovirgaceae bacterium]